MTIRKKRPSTHASGLAKLLAADNSCLFPVWFRSWHRDYETTGDGSDQADWNVRRSLVVRETAARLEQRGDDVYLELRNGFEATGSRSGGRIVGRPDIIVRHTDGSVTVYDVRSGELGATDEVLGKLYMYLLPRSNHGLWRRARPDGCVLYDDGTERRNRSCRDRRRVQGEGHGSDAADRGRPTCPARAGHGGVRPVCADLG